MIAYTGFDQTARGVFRQAVPAQRVWYGAVRGGGPLFFLDDSKPPYLYVGIMLSARRITRLRDIYIGGNLVKFDSNGEMVSFFSQVEFYGLGLDYPARYEGLINAITREDVQRVAREYLKPDQPILVVVGKQGDIELPQP